MKYSLKKEKFGVTPRLANLIKKFSYGKSLDAGCATGTYFKFFNGDIVGIDITQKYLQEIDISKFKNKKIQLKKADVRMLPYKSSEFNFVFSAAVLEYMRNEKDLKKAVGELKRVLKKGGYIVIITPHENIFTQFVRGKILSRSTKKKAKDEYFIMGRGYSINTLKKFGFEVHGCLGWVSWINLNKHVAKILDTFFWYVPFLSGSLVGIYEKK